MIHRETQASSLTVTEKMKKCGAAKILDRERPGIFADVAAGVDLINANMTLLEADNELRTSEDRQDKSFCRVHGKRRRQYMTTASLTTRQQF